jgi:uncharacterized protein YbjQ (UPF0145 family)
MEWNIVIVILGVIVVIVAVVIYSAGHKRQQERGRQKYEQQQQHAQQERERLATISTSSNNRIVGKRIVRQIQMVTVDNHTEQEKAMREFLLKVEAVGGNAVINMRVRRHHGGYVSVQGDAVVTERS